MKFNTQNLALVIVFQLIISGATLSISESHTMDPNTEDVRCNDPVTTSDTIVIGEFLVDKSQSMESSDSDGDEYLTLGVMSELDWRNEGKNETNWRKGVRDEGKTTHEYCSGIGEVCEYTGSPGCGARIETTGTVVSCEC